MSRVQEVCNRTTRSYMYIKFHGIDMEVLLSHSDSRDHIHTNSLTAHQRRQSSNLCVSPAEQAPCTPQAPPSAVDPTL